MSKLFAQTGHKPQVHGRQGGASFRLEMALEAPKSAIFSAARAQGGGLRPESATLTATIMHARFGPPVDVPGSKGLKDCRPLGLK